MRSTAPVRRAAVADALAGRSGSAEAVAPLRRVLSALESIPEDAKGRRLELEGGGAVHLDLGYEIEELRRDLVFLTAGEGALGAELEERHERLRDEAGAVVDALAGTRLSTFLTDRDGTVVNYCGRYSSSVQAAWNAVLLTRFARAAASRAVVLTSGPLRDVGIVDLSVTPPGAFLLAGSKGREYLDAEGRERRHPVAAGPQRSLDELNRGIDQLVREPGNEVFALVGSGVQHKLGQTTVARQDVASSIPGGKSSRFLASVRALVEALDPEGSVFRVKDTGLDVEVTLTVEGPGAAREFDKGDGVRYLDEDVPLHMGTGPCLVCGDTDADVPMLEAALERCPVVRSVFVARREELRSRVRAVLPGALFVSEPDALVWALGELATRLGGE